MTATLAPGSPVHLVGVGGAGMSPLARILLARGHRVSGSDRRGGRVCDELAALGATIRIGHDAGHVHGAALVAVSTAVPADNPEVVRAQELGLPVLHRAALLAALMVGHRALLVAGTHGKTTTTSMLAMCLRQAGRDPSFAIGGELQDSGLSAHHGAGGLFVAEADESDRSFLHLAPDLAVVTNVELDHHDAYASLEDTLAVFEQFLARRGADAPAVLCADDAGAAALADRVAAPVVRYGVSPSADARIIDVAASPQGTTFSLEHAGVRLGPVRLPLAGMHNVRNAAAAAVAARWAGADDAAILEALHGFAGARRRFQRLGHAAGVTVVDDYAHHPTEIAATLAAARQMFPEARIVAAFQPHRYSRTAALGAQLGAALAAADALVVCAVYAAGERPVAGADAAAVADAARLAGATVQVVGGVDEVPAVVAELVGDGDVVLTLGAGDITEAGPELLRLLGGRS